MEAKDTDKIDESEIVVRRSCEIKDGIISSLTDLFCKQADPFCWSKSQFLSELDNMNHSYIWFLEKESVIWGALLALLIPPECEVRHFCVNYRVRRRGVAKKILNRVINDCKNLFNIKKVFLEVATTNKAALGLYRQVGFRVAAIRSGYYDGKDAYLMSLEM
ncbi:MAG: GNAT family N-acetyltransferase [Candidatus Dadabacteria bacterium]|nr:MAG: GNAT family N-acetyltransferase [Candidatus Dadabacteria bacterium]